MSKVVPMKTKEEPNCPLKGLKDSEALAIDVVDQKIKEDGFFITLITANKKPKSKWNEQKKKVVATASGVFTSANDQNVFEAEKFEANVNDVLRIPGRGAFLGVGETKDYVKRGVLHQIAPKLACIIRNGTGSATTVQLDCSAVSASVDVAFLIAWIRLSLYQQDSFKGITKEGLSVKKLVVIDKEAAKDKARILLEADSLANATVKTMELCNSPANFLCPEAFARIAESTAKDLGVTYTRFNYQQAKDLGMNSFCGVSQGMKNEPAFIVLSYKNGTVKHRLALVGKGVCHDTGGYNIKSIGTGIHMMHMDMGGAATTLGSFQHMLHFKPEDCEIHCILPCVENLIDSDAYLPGDIVKAMNGMSIHVINTDAEGRLILNDGICWAQKLFDDSIKKDGQKDAKMTIVTTATLTGASIVAMSKDCAPFFSTSKRYADLVRDKLENNFESMAELPLLESLDKKLDDTRADIANLVMPLNFGGGCISAALFLKRFVTMENVEFMHFDIAGPCDKDGVATGIGPALYKDVFSELVSLR